MPLEFDTRRFFDPKRNGVLQDHSVERFLARRNGRCVGRVAAGWRRGGAPDGVGTFGFLALERDPEALSALLRAAGDWLAARGAARLRGPLSLTINHEAGALVEGFGRPGMVRMPRTPDWLPAMLEGAAGLAPERDVLACTLTLAAERHRARFAALLARWPGAAGLRVRPVDRRRFDDEIRLVTALYNDAWADNWGSVPVGEAEAATIARVMRPLLRAGAILIAEWEGEPTGVLSLIPNLEEATEGLGGRLLPFGWWRVAKVLLGRGRSARVPMLGTARRFRHHPVSAMAAGALLDRAISLAAARGWENLEISWILDDNAPMLRTMARLPAPVTGRWRLYGAPLPTRA